MKVNFKVMANNSDQETNLIWDKVQNIDFFEKFNYLLSLPDHIIVTNLIKRVKLNTQSKSDYSDLFNLIKTEIYDIADYRNGINNIYLHLKNVNLSFGCFQNYNKLWNFKYFDEYRILLTLYGPGGEYSPSSGEIIMLTTKNGEFRRSSNPLETIIHEMVHIGIEECIIQKFDIPHKVKEQIVDYLCCFILIMCFQIITYKILRVIK